MITFKSTEDLSKLSPDDPAFPLVKELIKELIEAYTWEDHPYNPEWYGYIILIEPEDVDRTLDELWDGCTLLREPLLIELNDQLWPGPVVQQSSTERW